MGDAMEEAFEQGKVEDRLSNNELGSRFHFPLEAPDFFIEVQGARIGADAD